MMRINCLLAILVANCFSCSALRADAAEHAGKCKVTYFTDATNPLTTKGYWSAIGNGTFSMLATCSANEVAISGGYHWDNPQNYSAGELGKWLVVGSTLYQSVMPQTFANGWQCVLQRTDGQSEPAPSGGWCAVDCCPK